MSLKIFICYAHEDDFLLNRLKMHLKSLQRLYLIDIWSDHDIKAGREWEQEINENLNTAQIILLLISPDFINSDYCYGLEMKCAIERHDSGETRVIPIILRHVYWQGAPFSKLQVLPTNGIPVISWSNLDEAFLNVTDGIRKAIESTTSHSPTTLTIASKNEQRVTKQHKKDERDITLDTQRETMLQAYIDKLSELLLEKNLRESQPEDEIRKIAHVRTLTALSRLDVHRKKTVLQLLYNLELIEESMSVIDLRGVDLKGIDLRGVKLFRANLEGANLGGAILNGVNLIGANLNRADLWWVDLREAHLERAELVGANLNVANLSEANLENANLSGAELITANLGEANLSDANLSRADLRVAVLSRAKLIRTNLNGADLSEADLSGADLSGAILNQTDLSGVNATIDQLDKARSLQGTIMPNGIIHF